MPSDDLRYGSKPSITGQETSPRSVGERPDIGTPSLSPIRDAPATAERRPWWRWFAAPLRQYLVTLAIVFVVTIANVPLEPIIGVHATALIFLLAVVLLALFVERGPTLVAAALSALVWDYFFLPPVFAFRVSHFEDAMLVTMYFVVALVLGQLTARIRAQQIALALDRARLKKISEDARVLAESERLSTMLLNSMSHEIRTPIFAINSATSNLAEQPSAPLSEPQKAMISEIQEATGRLNRLVGKVLDMTRLESGHMRPKLNECDVRELVNVVVAATEKDLAAHKLFVEIEPGIPIIRLDFVLMQEALSNLLSNAALHTPLGTEVRLAAKVENQSLLLAVSDRGPGIAPDSLPRVFDKFYRAPDAPAGGSGLGLSLVKGFVEALGGRVEAANQPGGGAVFTIHLPLGASPAPSSLPMYD